MIRGIAIMGLNGCGKSTLAHTIAKRLDFYEMDVEDYYFPEQSLEAILYRLSHVYGVQFTVTSEALNKRTFTGTFYRGQSIKDIMEIVNLSIPIKYRIDDRHITVSEI